MYISPQALNAMSAESRKVVNIILEIVNSQRATHEAVMRLNAVVAKKTISAPLPSADRKSPRRSRPEEAARTDNKVDEGHITKVFAAVKDLRRSVTIKDVMFKMDSAAFYQTRAALFNLEKRGKIRRVQIRIKNSTKKCWEII